MQTRNANSDASREVLNGRTDGLTNGDPMFVTLEGKLTKRNAREAKHSTTTRKRVVE